MLMVTLDAPVSVAVATCVGLSAGSRSPTFAPGKNFDQASAVPAGIVVGVAAATVDSAPILTAGMAGLVAGAGSMALGVYVSVSTQRDTEQALLRKERQELGEDPVSELDELTALYEAKGLSAATARTVAEELTHKDAFTAHAEVELGIDPHDLSNPWQAALSSAFSFALGALLPLAAILAAPSAWRIPITVGAVLLALLVTGAVSAGFGGAAKGRAVTRNVVGGGLALGIMITNRAELLLLYPVAVSFSLLFVFGRSLIHPPSMVERIARLSEPDLPPQGVRYTRQVTWVWCGFFALNGAIALATVFASREYWALYNGLVSYILMGLLFVIEWLIRGWIRRRHVKP